MKESEDSELKYKTILYLSVLAIAFTTISYKNIPNDFGKCDKLIKEFAPTEARAMEVYKLATDTGCNIEKVVPEIITVEVKEVTGLGSEIRKAINIGNWGYYWSSFQKKERWAGVDVIMYGVLPLREENNDSYFFYVYFNGYFSVRCLED